MIEAARVANAHGFISRLPHAYDTVIGERGHTFSGGERQRISIARAVLSNPRILILDEATSAVGTETERQIQEALDRLVKERTIFAIAHRLSTSTRADRLLVMKDDRLVEMGTHAELFKNDTGVLPVSISCKSNVTIAASFEIGDEMLITDLNLETDLKVQHNSYLMSGDGLLRKGDEIVTISRCFPWSEPLRWLSIRDKDEKELDLIEDPSLLDRASALSVMQAVGEAAFILKIKRIKSVEEQFELRCWTVELAEIEAEAALTSVATVSRFQTKLNAWPRELPDGGVLIQDVLNDFYLVENIERLDLDSQKLLNTFLD